MKRGDIYWADRRPVLILSHDGFNQAPGWRSIIVVPLSTSSAQAKRGPTAIPIPEGTGGLKKQSVALCHQVTTLDRSKLVEQIGALPGEFLTQIETGLKIAMDIDQA